MCGEHDMHRSKLLITNKMLQCLQMVDYMCHHQETHMYMALHMAADMAMAMAMVVVMGVTVSVTMEAVTC